MTVQEFVNIDKDLQIVQDISYVNIIILIYLFIKHVLFMLIEYYVHLSVFHAMSLTVHIVPACIIFPLTYVS
jgi:hypothetical protein